VSQPQQKTKELKITTRHVVTVDNVANDPRKLKLLHIIKHLGSVSEKALTHLVYWLQSENGISLGYNFISISGIPSSTQLREDINILLYLGLIEADTLSRKLKLTSNGLEFIDRHGLSQEVITPLLKAVDDLKSKVIPLDAEIDLITKRFRGGKR